MSGYRGRGAKLLPRLAAGLMLLGGHAATAGPVCQETIVHSDGSRSIRTIPDQGPETGSASSSAVSAGSAQSSVSVSSSSRDGASRSKASARGDAGRTVEVERDAQGCRITITEGE